MRYLAAMTLGARILQLRNHYRLTQAAFGEICNAGKSAVSQWESDATIPETDKLLRLREKLTFSLDWLLTGAGAMTGAPTLDPHRQKLLLVAEQLPDYAVVRLTEEGASFAQLIEQASKPKISNGGN